ncbi:TetR/AcrR family transcriptional regulator [Pseudonocardia sp. MH-G8]|uniref:TetR/AcrR family transcriptional regulator n=1 Tax=Pseudonocardia sp. MH-G8 TaxID=1854588 RepID=UPI000B9FDE3E|nr:TetR/AcrR family transcriptional regulator [Pseudonocardia sp. MH-G8]OZM76738.1 TetR family transcriptional regulator [Pseudonocardia sp. MH-G8]
METSDDQSAGTAGTTGRRGRGRRPADQVRAEVLEATARLLFADGLAAITFERVAAESGASKTTLYKWWPSRGALALDAYSRSVQPALAFPDTGDIAADLTAQLHAFVALTTDSPAGRVIAELIGQAQTDPDLAEAYRTHYSRPRRDLAVVAVCRARDRGQLRADTDPEAVVDQLWGACYHRLLVRDEPLTERFATTLVAQLLNGLHPPRQT